MNRIKKEHLFKTLPAEYPHDLRPQIQTQLKTAACRVVVLDDDPTGTQTVHDVPVLTEWSPHTLQNELTGDPPAFYILTNSRSLPLAEAREMNSEIGTNLACAARRANCKFVVVSRSDSTLRGHFPGEVAALQQALQQDFDGWIVVPFFPEGGRYTIENIHYVEENGWLVPAAHTEFAKDHVFGYRSSDLTQWVQEKSRGRFSADDVVSISLNDIRARGPERIYRSLLQIHNGRVCVVNAASYRDLEVLVAGLLLAEIEGKKFLYRTAASFVQVRAGLSPRPLLSASDLSLPDTGAGLVVVGSHVPRSSEQMAVLLEHPDIEGIEVHVEALLDKNRRHEEIRRCADGVDRKLAGGTDTVLYTSRRLVSAEQIDGSLSIGQRISQGLTAILQKLSTAPRFLLAKGGITASDVATKALMVRRAMVRGQILPGVPVWELGLESRFPRMPYIVFPGNVGDSQALSDVVQKLGPGSD